MLTEGATGLVFQISSSPFFTVNLPGFYKVHSVVYHPEEYSLVGYDDGTKTIFTINGELSALDICGDTELIGKNVVVNDCCNEDIFLSSSGESLLANHYQSNMAISSDALITEGPITFDSGSEINILPGFEVVLGVEFQCYIEGCD